MGRAPTGTGTGLGLAVVLLGLACSSGTGGGTSTGGSAASGGTTSNTGGATASNPTGGATASGGTLGSGGSAAGGATAASGGSGGASSTGGMGSAGTGGAGDAAVGNGGTSASGGRTGAGGATVDAAGGGGASARGGATGSGGTPASGGVGPSGGTTGMAGTSSRGGASGVGGTTSAGGATGSGGTTTASCSGPIGTISGALATGINFLDDKGNRVNAHGGGIIKEGDTFYLHGEYFLSTTTDNNFNGFSMYSSKDLATWKYEGIILPQQSSGELGPNRKGERPHIIKCPSTGEFVLYAHAASSDYQADKEVVYATSATVNGQYAYKGPLTNSSGAIAAHSDMSAITDGNNAYVVTESGHLYTLSADCHTWVSDKTQSVNGDSGGSESPTVFKAGSTYYWIGSYKTGWRANNNFYSTASALTGPWTYQGFIAPVTDTSTTTPSGQPNPPEWISDQRTWLSQSTWVMPVTGCNGTVYVYWGDHWYGNTDTSQPGKHNDQATYVFQPLVFNGTAISMPTYHETWKLDVGAGTWSP
jgi:hypothetical protein